MKNRIEELDNLLDDLDDEIMAKYPEIQNAWLHNAIAEKVKMEIERFQLLNQEAVRVAAELKKGKK